MPTKRQMEALAFIRKFARINHIAPSLEEMGEALNIHKCSARNLLMRLHKHGFIRRGAATWRNIDLGRRRMTKRQREAYNYISAFIERHGKPPKQCEIGAALSISVPAAHGLVHRLHEGGHIELEGRRIKGVIHAQEGSQA
jgi:SOS-response transcriptional repressor LexA